MLTLAVMALDACLLLCRRSSQNIRMPNGSLSNSIDPSWRLAISSNNTNIATVGCGCHLCCCCYCRRSSPRARKPNGSTSRSIGTREHSSRAMLMIREALLGRMRCITGTTQHQPVKIYLTSPHCQKSCRCVECFFWDCLCFGSLMPE